jgi:hypothetical protein
MSTAKTAAPAAVLVTPDPASPSVVVRGVALVRKWQSSLTIQGGIVSAAGTFVAAKGGAFLIGFGVSPAMSGELVGDLATLLGAAGVFMVAIGRLRLGDLK